MKAMTTWPEFAFAISDLDKRIENRTWLPPSAAVGTWIAIHAGKHVGGRAGRVADEGGVQALIEQASTNGWISVWVNGELKFYLPGKVKDPRVFSLSTVPKSAIVAVAYLESVTRKDVLTEMEVPGSDLDPCSSEYNYTAPWGCRDRYHWRFSQVIKLDEPISCNGKQRLWETGDELEIKIMSEVWKKGRKLC